MDKEIVPPQKEGNQSDNTHTIVCQNRDEAIALFSTGRKRLLDVNNWEKYCNASLSADFRLCDAAGKVVQRPAAERDFFQIDIPGPGPVDGDGYDWVQIVKIITVEEETEDTELISIQVRPASSPQNDKETVAHFFTEATSTFLVQRKGNAVTAAIHGRNEKPNTDTNLIDTVRNNMVAGAAVLRFSDVQWKQLAVGLIE